MPPPCRRRCASGRGRRPRSRVRRGCRSRGPLDHLDHAPERQFVGGKLGIDATAKWAEEGARPWPEEIAMSPEVKELVDRRWQEYGFGPHTAARSG